MKRIIFMLVLLLSVSLAAAAPNNLTDLQNAFNFVDVVKFTNDNTNGAVGIFLILTFFFITLFITLKKVDSFEQALLVASFVGFGMSIWLRVLEFVNYLWMISFLLIIFFDAYYIYKTKNWNVV